KLAEEDITDRTFRVCLDYPINFSLSPVFLILHEACCELGRDIEVVRKLLFDFKKKLLGVGGAVSFGINIRQYEGGLGIFRVRRLRVEQNSLYVSNPSCLVVEGGGPKIDLLIRWV